MNIAYVTSHNARDIHSWSGTPYHVAQALIAQGGRLNYIDNLSIPFNNLLKVKRLAYRYMGKKYLLDRELFVLKDYARQITRRLSPDTDVLFSPGSTPMALLDTKKPKVFYADATFASLLGAYDSYSNLAAETLRNGMAIEQASLTSSALAIYSSDWAAQSALDHYKVDPRKVHVVPFGANVEANRTEEDIQRIVDSRPRTRCRLLFLGVDWERKGGDKALAVLKALNERGLPTELHIAGIRSFPFDTLPEHVVDHGFISKSTPEGRRRIDDLLESSHFLILPTKAEAYGLVFAEANALGVPDLSTIVGGVPTIVKDGLNGQLFPLDAPAGAYADYVFNLFQQYDRYQQLALSSFHEFETRLNWASTGKRLVELIRTVL